MFYTLFFLVHSLSGYDYNYMDMSHIDRDQYECFFEEISPSIKKRIEYRTNYGSVYKMVGCSGAIHNRFKLPLRDFQYDDSIADIDGFYDYSASFKAEKNPDLRIIYPNYLETMRTRLARFYGLIGLPKSESPQEIKKYHCYGYKLFNRQLDLVIKAVKWDLGSLTQLKIIMAVFLDDTKNILYASMLKKFLSPTNLPLIDGGSFPKVPKKDQRTDIVCSNYPHTLVLFQLGKIFYPVQLVLLSEQFICAEKDTGIALPNDDSWIALSPDASEVLTYDPKRREVISMNNFQDSAARKKVVLCIAPQDTHIQHGIFINKHLLLLATVYKHQLHNIVFNREQNKFWILPDTIRFQHFLIADESLFPDRYVVGGFSSHDLRYQRWISQTKVYKDRFSCASDAFSIRDFSLNDALPIRFE